MADKQETSADIIAEIRALSNPIPDGIIAINGRIIADRLDAALKRERGNCAKLREALDLVDEGFTEGCLDAPGDCPTKHDLHRVSVIREKVKSALAAPPRNCDVGTLIEQQQRFHDFCEKMQHTDKACCGGCPIVYLRMQGTIDNSCELAWAQMPYKEGGDK